MNAAVRVVGSAVGWAVFALNLALLTTSIRSVLGGACAAEGADVLRMECADSALPLLVWAILGALAGVAIGALLAQGFGAPLTALAWPVAAGVLLLDLILSGSSWSLLLALPFVALALAPLLLRMRADPRGVLLGRRSASGIRFEGDLRALRSRLGQRDVSGAPRPGAGDWALGLGVPILGAALGASSAPMWLDAID